MKNLKIGDFARLNNTTVQTLRFYEKINLLKPTAIDTVTNYRYYDIMQSSILDNIQFLKHCGFSLTEIQKILLSDNKLMFEAEIKLKLNTLINEENLLKQKMIKLKKFIKNNQIYVENISMVKQRKIHFMNLPKRKMFTYRIDKNIYELSLKQYEYYLRKFKLQLARLDLPYLPFDNVGSLIKQSDFEKEYYYSDILFLFLDQNITPLNNNLLLIPAGRYAVQYCNAFENERTELEYFKKELEKRNIKIAGDYICEVIYEISNINKKREMFIRMQVLIED